MEGITGPGETSLDWEQRRCCCRRPAAQSGKMRMDDHRLDLTSLSPCLLADPAVLTHSYSLCFLSLSRSLLRLFDGTCVHADLKLTMLISMTAVTTPFNPQRSASSAHHTCLFLNSACPPGTMWLAGASP